MKAKMVKVYQSVYLGKKLCSHFPNLDIKDVQIEFIEGIGVKISGLNDAIVVPYPNVAYVQLALEEKEVKKGK